MDTKLLLAFDEVGGWKRKPKSWFEVGLPIQHHLLTQLKTYTSAELGIDDNVYQTLKKVPEDAVFLVTHRYGLYVVRTEGATYVRYIGRAL